MEESVQLYQKQLEQVNNALKIANNENELANLKTLQKDLQELLELIGSTSTKGNNPGHSVDPLDNEMALFISEISNIEKNKNSGNFAEPNSNDSKQHDNQTNDEEEKLESIKEDFKLMIGQKCSAPHQHSWGSINYHNAIICGLDDTKDYSYDEINNFRLRVLYTNPTHREMLPCSYFLDGECRFDEDRCHFSHGELVPFGNLQEYKEPSFEKLEKNCIVLAKMDDKLWHKGRVLEADFDQKKCKVRLENQKKKEIDFEFENLLPIFQDDLSSDSSLSDESSNNSEDDIVSAKKPYLIHQSLLNPSKYEALGQWEKHTNGMGSKLMEKMGYIVGTGLGRKGDGIIVPISAQILPPGKSLDYCMQLREAAHGDENLFNVERKMKKAQRKQEALSAKIYERESKKTDVFSFLNTSIFNGSTIGKTKNIEDVDSSRKKCYKKETTKSLNVASVRLSDDIKKIKNEIIKIKESFERQTPGTELYKKLQKMLDIKNTELLNLQNSENLLSREQIFRKHQDKLSIF